MIHGRKGQDRSGNRTPCGPHGPQTAFEELTGDVLEADLNEAGRVADAARDVTEQ